MVWWVGLHASTAKGMGLIPDWGTKIPHSTRPEYICVLCLVLSCVQLFLTPWTVALQAPLSLGILQAGILEWIAMPSSRGSSQPRDQTYISCIARQILYRLSHEGSPWILGVGSPSPLQGSIPTQELNRGLLHCRQILYQLSYKGSPYTYTYIYIYIYINY